MRGLGWALLRLLLSHEIVLCSVPFSFSFGVAFTNPLYEKGWWKTLMRNGGFECLKCSGNSFLRQMLTLHAGVSYRSLFDLRSAESASPRPSSPPHLYIYYLLQRKSVPLKNSFDNHLKQYSSCQDQRSRDQRRYQTCIVLIVESSAQQSRVYSCLTRFY